jgi:site-specific DNA-methyltransferase (adenine-specific)
MLQEAMVSSKTVEHITPQFFFNRLDKEFHFTLDPSATHINHKCEKYFTIKENGLLQDWSKDIVFMNPPYGGHTGDWIKKAYEESLKGAVVVCLIAVGTNRSYWHDYIFPYASQIRWLRGTLKFSDMKSTAPFACVVVVFNKRLSINYHFQHVWNVSSKDKKRKRK